MLSDRGGICNAALPIAAMKEPAVGPTMEDGEAAMIAPPRHHEKRSC
jgi:hypothetical protein